jgi:hypothetical protein
MDDRHGNTLERDLDDALRRLSAATVVPPPDPAREAALLAAFDAAGPSRRAAVPRISARGYWSMAALATAAAVLIAVGLTPAPTGRHGPLPGGSATHSSTPPLNRGVQLEPPSEFVPIPGAAALPPLESGTLVRIDLPVSVLSQYGVSPPPGRVTAVTADLIVGQDGLARAVRIVN